MKKGEGGDLSRLHCHMAALSRTLKCATCCWYAGNIPAEHGGGLGRVEVFIQPDRAQASQTLRHVADQLRQKWPKLAAFIDDSETDVLVARRLPQQHRTKLHSTNPLERLNKEVKRRADVGRNFSNEPSIVRRTGCSAAGAESPVELQHREQAQGSRR